MSFFSLIAALMLGYYRPMPQSDWLQEIFSPLARLLERNFNDHQLKHGIIAWLLAALLPVFVIAAAYIALSGISKLLGAVLAAGILYLVLRFGQFGAKAEQISTRLRDHNLDEARTLLADWEKCETQSYSAAEVARVSIEVTLRNAHHDLFAPVFWFILLGPAGALLYRLAYLLKHEWAGKHDDFGDFAQRAFDWLDWLPARFTAGSFAVVGDFEDAVYCWRTQPAAWPEQALGIILASGAGALGVRLGKPLPRQGIIEHRPELGIGDEADADYLQSATGLVWRVLAVMLTLLLLLTFAHWLGN
jgi:adenosylcobinamide-phosphate synthase